VVIKGSERITDWVNDGGTVWKAAVDNTVFGDFNPYAEEVGGDWIVYADGAPHKHLGEVYLDGLSFYEVVSRADVDDPPERSTMTDDWTGVCDPVRNIPQTKLVWFASVDLETTTIWANFQGADPNTETAVTIRHNRIHDCSLGTWLDWQTQGTRVSRNLYHHNSRDLFIEVSHGPYLVEHNVLASPASIELFSQGGAFVDNLVLGTLWLQQVLDRPTPYHRPHSTQVAGYANIVGGDDRYRGNVFIGGDPASAYQRTSPEVTSPAFAGTAAYDGYPASFEAYQSGAAAAEGDHQRFEGRLQAVYAVRNVYAGGARPFEGESDPVLLDAATARIVDEGDEVYLVTDLPQTFARAAHAVVTGADLPPVRFADADFEERDGSPAVIDVDLTGAVRPRDAQAAAGPIAGLAPGRSRLRVW
jgi:hypothetical protein